MADEKTLRDEIEDAFEAEPTDDETTESQEPEQSATETVAEEETQEEVSGEEAGEAQQSDPEPAPVVEDAAESEPENKPPVGWSPANKEQWSELPSDIRDQISARERDIAVNMEETANARKLADGFIKTVEPYRAIMAAEGVQDPLVAINGLMEITAVLQTGSAEMKAQRIAGLIQHYGVDIKTLDQTLAGLEPETPQPASDPRVDQIWDYIQNQSNQSQSMTQNAATESVNTFAKDHEFMDDPKFRATMADFMDVASRNGQNMTLEDAHIRTVAALPEYAAVMAQRKAQADSAKVLGKTQAASSITGTRGGGQDGQKLSDLSLREMIAAQFDEPERV